MEKDEIQRLREEGLISHEPSTAVQLSMISKIVVELLVDLKWRAAEVQRDLDLVSPISDAQFHVQVLHNRLMLLARKETEENLQRSEEVSAAEQAIRDQDCC